MKTRFRGLALTAILLSGTSMTFAQQGASSAVGDLPGYGEEAYFHEEATYAPNGYVTPTRPPLDGAMGYAPSQSPDYAPVGVTDLQPASFRIGGQLQTVAGTSYTDCDSPGCIGDCNGDCNDGFNDGSSNGFNDGSSNGFNNGSKGGFSLCKGCGSTKCFGCSSLFGKRAGKFCSIFDHCGPDTWAQLELLTWFVPDRDMPALVTTSAPGTLPVLPAGGANGVSIAYGDPIEGEISAGFRGDVGKYITKNVGIGGRLWYLSQSNDAFSASGDGSTQSIGRPFFNSSTGTEDALLVALDGVFTGAVAGNSTLELWAAEAYGRVRFSCSKSCRLDFIGGYSHFAIDDTLEISSTTITNATARTRTFNDIFEAENRFNGGQVGFEMVITRGRWMARSLTKVHIGNMEQSIRIAGNSSDQTPPAAATATSGGMLALGNQGTFKRDEFAFAPEANFKLGYRVRKNVLLSAGYTFIYWDNVALTGDVVDRVIDGTTFNTGTFAARPAFDFDDSSLWAQGLDLGLVIDY
jgi:hypothetical protein